MSVSEISIFSAFVALLGLRVEMNTIVDGILYAFLVVVYIVVIALLAGSILYVVYSAVVGYVIVRSASSFWFEVNISIFTAGMVFCEVKAFCASKALEIGLVVL
ncbi:MAG: hypothetical protein DHS20C13_28600 [Thermodesulfobacteriota bacterium]|nr:MAG: hypothetical protein DHS20C13_28600 [Thermodesulfobacteriota bacterium]